MTLHLRRQAHQAYEQYHRGNHPAAEDLNQGLHAPKRNENDDDNNSGNGDALEQDYEARCAASATESFSMTQYHSTSKESKTDAITNGIEEPSEVKQRVPTKRYSRFCKVWNKFDDVQRQSILKDVQSTIRNCICKGSETSESDSDISDDPEASKWDQSGADTDRELLDDETSNCFRKILRSTRNRICLRKISRSTQNRQTPLPILLPKRATALHARPIKIRMITSMTLENVLSASMRYIV